MKYTQLISICCFAMVITLGSCKSEQPSTPDTDKPSSELGTADDKAAAIFAKSLVAMGGEQAWNDLSYVSWTFFGARHLVWDKLNSRVRIETPRDSSVYLLDMKTMETQFSKNGVAVTDTAELAKLSEKAKRMWINDSYWLVMPFKLRDKGVNLTYVRQDTLPGGQLADVLQMRFKRVGVTPNNMYQVYVDRSDDLIKKWDFFANFDQEKASKSWPWDNYQQQGSLMISSDRSDKSGPSNVRVYDQLEDAVFTSLDAFDFY